MARIDASSKAGVLKTDAILASTLLVLAGSLFIALTAQIAVPIGPVPISGQTLGVLLVAGVLGSRRGALAVLTYLAEGLAGLPVFAGGRAGVMVLAGPTGGYLVGFVAAAVVVGVLCENGFDRRPSTTFLAMAAGTAVIYVGGVVWLARFTGWETVFAVGVAPFLVGDAIKASIAALALPLTRAVARRRRPPA
jgi:biotin transporter BioY